MAPHVLVGKGCGTDLGVVVDFTGCQLRFGHCKTYFMFYLSSFGLWGDSVMAGQRSVLLDTSLVGWEFTCELL